MITLDNGWAQWDWQIGTFRAEIDNGVYGKFTGDINTASELAQRVLPFIITNEQLEDLESEKQSMLSITQNQEGVE